VTAFVEDDIRELLDELGARLEAVGRRASVYVFGGSALALMRLRGRSTEDIDVVSRDWAELVDVVGEMALDYDLPSDWMNVKGAGFAVGSEGDADAVTFATGGLTVRVASGRHLLAYKLRAARVSDEADIQHLLDDLGVRSVADAVTIARSVVGDDPVPDLDYDDLALYLGRYRIGG